MKLGGYIAGYRCCSPLGVGDNDVMYIASRREVVYRVLIPDGPVGYSSVPVPKRISTLSGLLKFLGKTGEFTLK